MSDQSSQLDQFGWLDQLGWLCWLDQLSWLGWLDHLGWLGWLDQLGWLDHLGQLGWLYYPASRDLSYCHEERNERETSANCHSIFWCCRHPETWTYQSGLKLVWRLCSHATTTTAVFLWDYELVAMWQYYPLTYCQICSSARMFLKKYGVDCSNTVISPVLQWFCEICLIKVNQLQNQGTSRLPENCSTLFCIWQGYICLSAHRIQQVTLYVNTFHLNNAKREVQSSFHLEISSS